MKILQLRTHAELKNDICFDWNLLMFFPLENATPKSTSIGHKWTLVMRFNLKHWVIRLIDRFKLHSTLVNLNPIVSQNSFELSKYSNWWTGFVLKSKFVLLAKNQLQKIGLNYRSSNHRESTVLSFCGFNLFFNTHPSPRPPRSPDFMS